MVMKEPDYYERNIKKSTLLKEVDNFWVDNNVNKQIRNYVSEDFITIQFIG